MKRTIGIGVIGMGWMGEVHCRAYRQLVDRFYEAGIIPRLIVCSDNQEDRARSSMERFGFEEYTTDWRAVLSHPEVEVVNITAPTGMHLELITAAAEAGKHVYCEKPGGKVPQEIALAEQAIRRHGVNSCIGYNYRWAPLVQYTRQLLDSGKLGRLTHYHGRFLNCYASDPLSVFSWRFQQETGLGCLGDLMSHTIDMAHMLMGPIQSLTANMDIIIKDRPLPGGAGGTHFSKGTADAPKGRVTNDDYVSALVKFENGVQGILESCRVINGPKSEMGFEIFGAEGSVKWNFETMNELKLQYRNANQAEDGYTTIYSCPSHPFHQHFNPANGAGLGHDDLKVIEAYLFLKSVAEGKQGEQATIADALAVANVQQAILDAWRGRCWQDVRSLRLD